MLPADNGRPPSTCSEECRLTWKAARQRAKRAQQKGITALRAAAVALSQVEGPHHAQVVKVLRRLSLETPSRLARVLETERTGWGLATLPGDH